MPPFPKHDMMLATEVIAQNLTKGGNWNMIAKAVTLKLTSDD